MRFLKKAIEAISTPAKPSASTLQKIQSQKAELMRMQDGTTEITQLLKDMLQDAGRSSLIIFKRLIERDASDCEIYLYIDNLYDFNIHNATIKYEIVNPSQTASYGTVMRMDDSNCNKMFLHFSQLDSMIDCYGQEIDARIAGNKVQAVCFDFEDFAEEMLPFVEELLDPTPEEPDCDAKISDNNQKLPKLRLRAEWNQLVDQNTL